MTHYQPQVRGYSIVALVNPKNSANVGSILRACGNFNVHALILGGPRPLAMAATDTNKTWRHLPFLCADDVFTVLPFGCTPVAVEMTDNATSLPNFVHPERAFYIFGPEDATLDRSTLERCDCTVTIPTNGCLNLAAAVTVVLYDRMAKSHAAGRPRPQAATTWFLRKQQSIDEAMKEVWRDQPYWWDPPTASIPPTTETKRGDGK